MKNPRRLSARAAHCIAAQLAEVVWEVEIKPIVQRFFAEFPNGTLEVLGGTYQKVGDRIKWTKNERTRKHNPR